MKTPAIVFRQADRAVIEEVDVPPLRPEEVRVRTACSGISIGTERSIFSGARTENGTFPFVGGYMASGTVEAIGEDCRGFHVGQRVVTHTSRLDGEVKALWGGHAGVQTTHHSVVMPIPDRVSFEDASMFVLPCVSFNAVSVANLTAHDTVLIQGGGLIGQMFGQAARNRGARIVLIEPNADRAALARRYVTDDVLSPDEADPAEVKRRLGGKAATVVAEATGVGKLLDRAVTYLANGGRFVALAWYPGSVSVTPHPFHARGATVLFPTGSGGPDVFRAVLDAMERGTLVLGENITHRFKADDAPGAYRRIVENDPSIMGMVLDWRNL